MSICIRKLLCGLAMFLVIPNIFAMKTERVSVSSVGDQANNRSGGNSLSVDGRYVLFSSSASNLVAGDTNGEADTFVHDRATGITERVSVSSTGDQANRFSGSASISADGRFVVFSSSATNLVSGDINSYRDIFVHDRSTRITERVNVTLGGEPADGFSAVPSISADGRFVEFFSRADNLVAGDTNVEGDIFVYDRTTGITERVNVTSSGEQVTSEPGESLISTDGRFVVISTAADLVPDDPYPFGGIFVRDRTTGVIELVSVSTDGGPPNRGVYDPSISADGRFIAFRSDARNLVAEDTNFESDIFVHDRVTRVTERVNLSSSGEQAEFGGSREPSISADGRLVTFASSATNLVDGDTNNLDDIFVHDRFTRVTKRVNLSSAGKQAEFGDSSYPGISGDGRFVMFPSNAKNLVAGDTNRESDAFVIQYNQLKTANDLTVSLTTPSSATQVGEYSRFRAKLTNTTNQTLINCKVDIINPLVKWQREFSFYTRPLNVANPVLNDSIDIAPGETGQFILAVLPRVAMRKQVRFDYTCDTTQAYIIPFLNTVHLVAKTEPLISEDFVVLTNAFPKTQLLIDRNNGKFWTAYTVLVRNNGSQPASVNLTTTSDLTLDPKQIPPPRLCEPVDPATGDWSCRTPRAKQLQVELAGGESKKIRVFVHAFEAIVQQPVKNRIVIEARDQTGDVVAKTSMGISTLN